MRCSRASGESAEATKKMFSGRSETLTHSGKSSEGTALYYLAIAFRESLE